jgi:hypothetical protein
MGKMLWSGGAIGIQLGHGPMETTHAASSHTRSSLLPVFTMIECLESFIRIGDHARGERECLPFYLALKPHGYFGKGGLELSPVVPSPAFNVIVPPLW